MPTARPSDNRWKRTEPSASPIKTVSIPDFIDFVYGSMLKEYDLSIGIENEPGK
jgi:hypothetical protein